MNHTIQFVHMSSDKTLADRVRNNLLNLGSKYDWIIKADVFLKKEKDTFNGKGHICEFIMSVPGPSLFASSDAPSFEEAIADVTSAIERQLQQRKAELYRHP